MNMQALSDWESKIQRHRVTLLDNLLQSAVIVGAVAMALIYISLPDDTSMLERWTMMAPFFAGWLVVLIIRAWRRLDHRYKAMLFILVAYVLGSVIFARSGLSGSGRVWLLLLPVLAFVLLGQRSGIGAGVVSILIYGLFTLAIGQGWVVPQVDEDLTALTMLLSEGGLFLLVAVVLTLALRSFYQSWLESLAGASATNRQLQGQVQELEKTNRGLQRETSRLQATAEIARAGSSILEPQKLMAEVIEQIQAAFSSLGVYYVGLFLLDETQQFVELKAATGEAGRLSLQMGYKVELDEKSAVGWCIIHKQAHIVLNVGQGVSEFDVLSMPETRSEIALPLYSRGSILGALTVQSNRQAAFSEADFAILQTMADLVAVAIDNAQLFTRTETALEEVQTVQRHRLRQTWKDFLAAAPVTQVDYARPGIEPEDNSFLRDARQEAMAHGKTVTIQPQPFEGADGTALVVPLKLREEVIGTIALRETDHRRSWTVEEIAMAEAIAEQVALTLDNLRLFEQVQRRAEWERLIGEITARMRETLDVETVLKTAAQEIRQALGLPELAIRLAPRPGGGAGNGAEKQGVHVKQTSYREWTPDGGNDA